VFSFIYGIPPLEILEECRAKHIVTIGTATTPETVRHFKKPAWMPSSLPASKQGTSQFIPRAAEDSLTGTFSLVPQIADVVNVPVIAAGGIADARGVVAALALAQRPCKWERYSWRARSPAPASFIARLYEGKSRAHRADKGFTGRLARESTTACWRVEPGGTAILPYPLQRRLVRNLAIPAEAAGDWISCPYGLGKVPTFLLAPTYWLF